RSSRQAKRLSLRRRLGRSIRSPCRRKGLVDKRRTGGGILRRVRHAEAAADNRLRHWRVSKAEPRCEVAVVGLDAAVYACVYACNQNPAEGSIAVRQSGFGPGV